MALQKLEKFELGKAKKLVYRSLTAKFATDLLKELEDKGKELDPEVVIRSFNKLLLRYAPGVQGYDKKSGESAVEFVQRKVQEARVAINRDRLQEIHKEWKSVRSMSLSLTGLSLTFSKKGMQTIQVLSKIESLLALEEASGVTIP